MGKLMEMLNVLFWILVLAPDLTLFSFPYFFRRKNMRMKMLRLGMVQEECMYMVVHTRKKSPPPKKYGMLGSASNG